MYIPVSSGRVVQVFSTFKAGILPIAVMALALQGCGSEPGSTSFLTVTQPTADYAIVDESTGGGGGGGDTGIPAGGSQGAGVVTTQVSAAAGGQMVCGRHTLTIPPGALKADANLTMIDMTSASGYPCVQILPTTLKFNSNVTLTTEVSDLQDPQTSTMFWIHSNPRGKAIWSSVAGSVAPNGTAITAPLGKPGVFAVTSSS